MLNLFQHPSERSAIDKSATCQSPIKHGVDLSCGFPKQVRDDIVMVARRIALKKFEAIKKPDISIRLRGGYCTNVEPFLFDLRLMANLDLK